MKCNYNGCSSKCKGDIDSESCNVLRAYQQGKADAIEELKKKIKFVEEWIFDDCRIDEPNVTVAFETLKHYGEHMQKGAEE